MAQVAISVNGRHYTVACDDGEEEHLQSLAQLIDQRVGDLTKSVGQVGDTRLLLMASLVLADEMTDQSETVAELEAALNALRGQAADAIARSGNTEGAIAQLLDAATRRIEDIARRFA